MNRSAWEELVCAGLDNVRVNLSMLNELLKDENPDYERVRELRMMLNKGLAELPQSMFSAQSDNELEGERYVDLQAHTD